MGKKKITIKKYTILRWLLILIGILATSYIFKALIFYLDEKLMQNNNDLLRVLYRHESIEGLMQTLWMAQVTIISLTIPIIVFLLSNEKKMGYSLLEIINYKHKYGKQFLDFFDIVFIVFAILILSYLYMVKIEVTLLILNTIILIIVIFLTLYTVYKFSSEEKKTIKYLFEIMFKYMNDEEKRDVFISTISRIITSLCSENYNRNKIQTAMSNLNSELYNNVIRYKQGTIEQQLFEENNGELKAAIGMLLYTIMASKDHINYLVMMKKIILSNIEILKTITDKPSPINGNIGDVLYENMDYYHRNCFLSSDFNSESAVKSFCTLLNIIREQLEKLIEDKKTVTLSLTIIVLLPIKNLALKVRGITDIEEAKKKIDNFLEIISIGYPEK